MCDSPLTTSAEVIYSKFKSGILRPGGTKALFNEPEIWHILTMTTITLEKAQQDLPELISRALAGEDIVIVAGDRLVRLTPSPNEHTFNEANARRRGYGSMKGQFEVPDSFFEPLPEAELRLWEGRSEE